MPTPPGTLTLPSSSRLQCRAVVGRPAVLAWIGFGLGMLASRKRRAVAGFVVGLCIAIAVCVAGIVVWGYGPLGHC